MILPLILLAATLSLDSLGVAFAYGLQKKTIPWKSRAIISVCCTLYFGVAQILGSALGSWMDPRTAAVIGLVLMGLLCLYMTLQLLLKPRTHRNVPEDQPRMLWQWTLKRLGITLTVVRNPMLGDLDSNNNIDIRESVYLSAALSVDAIGVGVGYTMTGAMSWWTPLFVGGFAFLFVACGNMLGLRAHRHSPKRGALLQIISCAVLWGLFAFRIACL